MGGCSYYTGCWVRRKSLIDKKGYFPTGLLHRLPKWPMTITDNRIRPAHKPQAFIINGNPYHWQVEACKAAERACRGIISAPTGTGKSIAMALLITRLNVKTLVVVPSLEIKKQLSKVFSSLTLSNVTIENVDAPSLMNVKDFDCLIIDEAHHVAAKTYHSLNKLWKNIYYRFFFTATPFRNDTEEMLLFEAIAGQLIYQLSYKEAVLNKYIVPVEAYSVEIPKTKDIQVFTYREVYNELVVNNEKRNNMISIILLRLRAAGTKTLCLVREVKHGKILSDITGIPFVSGEDEESRKLISQFNGGELNSLIATTGIMGEGVDTKPCQYVVIAGLGKAKSQFMQQIGRAVRTYPGKETANVVLIRDTSHKFTLKHYNQQKKILLDEYGVVPVKIEV
jgi:superfamily II DNA or RNA helicase